MHVRTQDDGSVVTTSSLASPISSLNTLISPATVPLWGPPEGKWREARGQPVAVG